MPDATYLSWVNASDYPLATTGIGLVLVIILSYVAGRLHQWARQTNDREAAYRDGYDTATKGLFSLATRATKASQSAPAGNARVTPPPAFRNPRHRAEDKTEVMIDLDLERDDRRAA